MPPAADRSPSTPLSGRRIVSRIASPFANKSRSVTDFFIEVDDPHKQYSPGDVVSGSVRLRVLKPTRVTHLVVCLHGFVQVFKNPGSPGEGFRANSSYLGTGRGKKSGEYFGNGFASLFEDEVVLCGDGRLAEGSYQFNFELEFPDRDLPSSIDFERGTISYMITATMTRPTTISPVMHCDQKVYFVERIDISPLLPPKSRTITLEPLSKRSRAKHQARKLVDPAERRSRKTDSEAPSELERGSRASSAPSTVTDGESPLSPVPSEASVDSTVSSQRETSQPDSGNRHSPMSSDLAKSSIRNKTITATVESLTGGCLRGDCVSIKVNIDHTKPIRSLYGGIVTLYRQARVDMHPAIPLGPTEKGAEDKFEDYYPKSITGLGGLSLSGAGSSHVFRKDLAQVMVPLYVDPTTLRAEVNAKVRVPEEAFPTISTVPGAMISFRYYTEVVLDIQGKLGSMPGGPQMGDYEGHNPQSAFSAFGSTIVDTAPIRRDKGVVVCTFEVVVGTRDSERRKGKRKVEPMSGSDQSPEQPQQRQPGAPEHDASEGGDSYYWYDQQGPYHDPQWYRQPQQPQQYLDPCSPSQGYDYTGSGYNDVDYQEQPPPMPIPHIPDESGLTEKERLRRAEERLLPSQPPGDDDAETEVFHGATAPYLADDATPRHTHGQADQVTQPPGGPGQYDVMHAPEYRPLEPGSFSQGAAHAGDDKREMQRRRLEMESSAPPVDEAAESSNVGPDLAPSAPTIDEADGHAALVAYDSHADAAGFTGLPRYER